MIRTLQALIDSSRVFPPRASLILAFAMIAGCTTSDFSDPREPQPRVAAYNCGAEGSLTVENFQTSVHVISSRGMDVELPASPPGSRSRYGEAPYALLLNGREALWLETGKSPLSCRR